MQDSVGDGNPATSEGLFVFSSVPVGTGDRVRVRGNAAEFTSSGSSLTELSSVSSVQVCSSGNALPSPVDVSLPVDNVSDWERYEGMLVRVNQQLVVTGTFNLGQFGQIDLAPSLLYQPTQTPGNSASFATATDLIRRSILALDDSSSSSGVNLNGGGLAPYPSPGLSTANTLRAGALVNPNGNPNGNNPPIPLIGILDERFGSYRIQPTGALTFSNAPNPRPDTAAVAASVGGRFKIASANVLNFFTTLGSRGAATATELDHQRTKIVAELSKTNGDVIGLSELQNFANGRNWLTAKPTSDPAGVDRRTVLIGDFNAYFGEDPIQAFLGTGGYTNLINLLLGAKAYSYNFGSQAGYLDHGLVNSAALGLVRSVAELHINADEPAALEALDSADKSLTAQAAYYAGNEFAASDHDPFVIGFNPLLGDFSDDGVLDETDRSALLRARGQSGSQIVDRRMDLNHDNSITQDDFLIWQDLYVQWKKEFH